MRRVFAINEGMHCPWLMDLSDASKHQYWKREVLVTVDTSINLKVKFRIRLDFSEYGQSKMKTGGNNDNQSVDDKGHYNR